MRKPRARAALPAKKLAVLHVAKKQLGLTEADYRAVLFGYGGVESAADLTEDGFRSVMAADSDEAGHAFQYEGGHLFRSEAGRGSDLIPATAPRRLQIAMMMFWASRQVKRARIWRGRRGAFAGSLR